MHGSRRIRTFGADPVSAVLRDVAGHATSGALRPVVDRVYPLADIAAAHRAFEPGGVVGKHVVTVPRRSVRRSPVSAGCGAG
ncbi:zinc-binding dehydrogenase [Streptomyces sp. R39]|uniref:Zinc-binding dehydrogenase n=1 Tax=Streptomyces sp. R39 TaxID=3238631 RepID=A0AB39QLE2_9ACTN